MDILLKPNITYFLLVHPMRIIETDRKHGTVEVEVEDSDDLWHLYNIIDRGDSVCGYTMREVKVSRGAEEERGGRRRFFLCISVEDMGFQTFTEKLRIKGRVTVGPDEMNIQGSFHAFAVGIRDRIRITKSEWLSFHEERLQRAASRSRPKVIAITLDDQDATLFLIRDYQMDEILTISSHIPGKYVDTSDRPALKSKYFGAIAEEVSRLLQREPAAIVAAGPGFTKNDLAKVLRERLKGAKVLEENTSSTGEPGVREVMARGALSKLMEDSTMLRDSRLVDEFLSRLSKSPNMVSYGAADVERTVDRGAVESLLVSEKLLKSIPPEERRGIEALSKKVERYGGRVFFIGGEHEKGRQLANMGGIAAILRFAVSQGGS